MSESVQERRAEPTKIDGEELLNLMEVRQIVYTFLSEVLEVELSPSYVKTLWERTKGLQNLPAVLRANYDTKLADALKLLVKTTALFNRRNEERVAIELASEYAKLFLDVKRIPAYPSESVYRNSTHCQMQKEWDQVMIAYEKAGFKKDENFFIVPEDHIALELAFMAKLSEEAMDLLLAKDREGFKESLTQQEDFLQKHLGLWVEDLATNIIENAGTDFYVAIGNITARFVKLDERRISDTIESLSA